MTELEKILKQAAIQIGSGGSAGKNGIERTIIHVNNVPTYLITLGRTE